ncbi:MAG: PAS domain S-box protein [Bacillota bacterium]
MADKYWNKKTLNDSIVEYEAAELEKPDIDPKMAAKLFRILFNNSPSGIYTIQNGRFKLANPQFQRMTGYNLAELRGLTSPLRLVHPKDRAHVREKAQEMLEGSDHEPYQYRYVKKDGGAGWVMETVMYVQDSSRQLILGNVIDITNLKMVEKEATDSQEYYRILFEHSRDAVFAVTPEARYIKVNPAACRMLGYKQDELMKMTIFDLMSSDSDKNPFFDSLLRQGHVFGEISLKNKDGSSILAEINATELPDGNFIGTVRDITERKVMEQEMARLERLNLIGEMAAGIGHEVRNPMTSVRGFLQMLSTKEDCSKYSDFFKIMIEELDRANSIITEYLSLAKNNPLDLRSQNLNDIINAMGPLIAADSINSQLNYIIELGDIGDLPLDEKQIRQLILNLVRNGKDAMDSDGTITIKTFKDGNETVLMVQDQGKGISPDIIDKIGNPFFTTKENGTGLGLAVCYSIASRHKANIKFQTGPAGTAVYLHFKSGE